MGTKTYEMQGDAALPNDTVQLLHKAPSSKSVLRGLVVSEGLEIERVFVGRSQLSRDEAIGKEIPPESYLIVLVRNVTEEVLIAKGSCLIEGDNLPSDNPLGVRELPPASGPSASPPIQVVAPVPVSPVPVSPPAAPVRAESPRITPGANEILVLLSRGHAEELNRSLKTQMLPHGATVADVTRRLDQALRGQQ